MSSSGYSATPLARKLGYKSGMRAHVQDPPADYAALLAPLPEPLHWQPQPDRDSDLVHLFCRDRAALAAQLQTLRAVLKPDATLWVSWPKKASKQPTDISEDTIRADALPLGWVDIKVCAVDAVWSGLKLVLRRELR